MSPLIDFLSLDWIEYMHMYEIHSVGVQWLYTKFRKDPNTSYSGGNIATLLQMCSSQGKYKIKRKIVHKSFLLGNINLLAVVFCQTIDIIFLT